MRLITCFLIAHASCLAAQTPTNATCFYPASGASADQIAEFQNDYGWEVHCSSKFLGGYYNQHGFIAKDLNILAEKANLVLPEGQDPISGQAFGAAAVWLYQLFQGKLTQQIAQSMAQQIVTSYFGAANQYSGFNVIAPPSWFSNPNCYNQTGSLANVLRNDTLTGMLGGMTSLLTEAISNFPPHCDGFNLDYDAAYSTLCDFFDKQYAYCKQVAG